MGKHEKIIVGPDTTNNEPIPRIIQRKIWLRAQRHYRRIARASTVGEPESPDDQENMQRSAEYLLAHKFVPLKKNRKEL